MEDYTIKRLKRYALSRGAKLEVAEDFASNCIVLFMSGTRDTRTKPQYLYADFVRKETLQLRKPLVERPEFKMPTKLPRGLTIHQRVAVILYASWGFTLKEVAHVLGVSEGQVSYLLSEMA